jgi:AcrR family transcriptional regulator
MARTANTRKEDTHDQILAVASRALRRDGYAGVHVAEVMKEAGLTHGGFYAHFPSRDALLVEALARAGRDSAAALARAADKHRGEGASAFRSLVETYLSDRHLVSCETGCPVAALGSDMPRQSLAVRAASALRVERLIDSVRDTLPGTSRGIAAVITGTLVGTLQLARGLGDNDEGRAVLAAARDTLIRQYDKPAARS